MRVDAESVGPRVAAASEGAESWASSARTRTRMQAVSRRDTRPELEVRRRLHAVGLRYRVDWPLPTNSRRRADIAFPRRRLVVFIDGCFWHRCPLHFSVPATNSGYWDRKTQANRQRDLETRAALRDAGWRVLAYWEHESPETVAVDIVDTLRVPLPDARVVNARRSQGAGLSRVVEMFGHHYSERGVPWSEVVTAQECPYTGRRCYKTRKSDPATAIGTCTVAVGADRSPLMICPNRLLERGRIFTDCLPLMPRHDPGNDVAVVAEVGIPGGSIDYVLVSLKAGVIVDFVGVELQTLDTTGTVWPERQRLVTSLGIAPTDDAGASTKTFGVNWKMTAKTILVQVHHKVITFEHLGKKLVLVVQDDLMSYIKREFKTDHLASPAELGHAMQFHPYSMMASPNGGLTLAPEATLSTDSDGVATCLGLQAEPRVSLSAIESLLSSKLSRAPRLDGGSDFVWPPGD